MELSLSQKQTQTLSPQMMQSMEILQMGSQELLEYIEEAVQENPVLEVDEHRAGEEPFADLRRKLEWLESTDPQNRYYHQQDNEEDNPIERFGGVDAGEESLYRYVLSQLATMDLAEELREPCVYLVESLDANGWLDEDPDAAAAELGVTRGTMDRALEVVQSLEPAGVGARSLKECLALQLKRRGEEDSLAMKIVEGYLDAVAKCRYGLIAKELEVSQEEVRSACERIKRLEPRPGTGFAARENLTYITPDIIVVSFADHFELLTNDYFFPTLHLSGYYQNLLKESGDKEVQDYLADKVRQAKWVVRSIEQRRSTLLECAQCILDVQEAFFRKGAGYLRPMTLADVAGKLGVHESTVSRAVKDKYIQCAMGVYPLSYFFSRGLGGQEQGGASPEAAKALLKKLVAEEDPQKPLSDQKLCLLMEQEGCTLSRRTVAKYRDELGILNAAGRRTYSDK